jgi:hypothetical protein
LFVGSIEGNGRRKHAGNTGELKMGFENNYNLADQGDAKVSTL